MTAMPSYIALLRAVNIGKRQVKMASLREWLEEDGFTDVETYIQTGNVKVTTRMRTAARVEAKLEKILAERCGFEVVCIVFTPAQLSAVLADAEGLDPPFGKAEGQRRYVVFFKDAVPAAHGKEMADYAPADERIFARGRAVHVWIRGSFHEAKVFGKFAKELTSGTNRDLKVVRTLVEKWGA
jgi:uncharacterized protein (DUF1697 family)